MAMRMLFLSTLLVLAGAAAPPPPSGGVTVHMINGVSEKFSNFPLHLNFTGKTGVFESVDVRRGEEYALNVGGIADPTISCLFMLGEGGVRTVDVLTVSDTSRDEGRANIYWKANDTGVSLSYDNAHYKLYSDWKPAI